LPAKASPKKNSFEFSKNVSSSTVTDVPTVEIDCAFLLGAIIIIGISAANTALNGKVRIISNFINFLSIGIKFQATANFTLQN
jgi:hypothetical protein